MASIPFLSQALLNSGNTETSLRVAGLSRHPRDGLCDAVSSMLDLRWYALRQSAGSTHVEAVAAHRGMDGQYHAFREELMPAGFPATALVWARPSRD